MIYGGDEYLKNYWTERAEHYDEVYAWRHNGEHTYFYLHPHEYYRCVQADPTYKGEDKDGEYAVEIRLMAQNEARRTSGALPQEFYERVTKALRFCEANKDNLIDTFWRTHERWDGWRWYRAVKIRTVFDLEKALNDPASYKDVDKIICPTDTETQEQQEQNI